MGVFLNAKLTEGGNRQRPEIDFLTEWVKDEWEKIPSDMIAKSFLKCCNALDGSEDESGDENNHGVDDEDDV